ncbi:hypothetical protein BU26DRAFT_517257, partial [Trematosphaeria pertusa]
MFSIPLSVLSASSSSRTRPLKNCTYVSATLIFCSRSPVIKFVMLVVVGAPSAVAPSKSRVVPFTVWGSVAPGPGRDLGCVLLSSAGSDFALRPAFFFLLDASTPFFLPPFALSLLQLRLPSLFCSFLFRRRASIDEIARLVSWSTLPLACIVLVFQISDPTLLVLINVFSGGRDHSNNLISGSTFSIAFCMTASSQYRPSTSKY